MATNYTGNATPTLSNAPASTWTDDAAKRSHVGNTYLVTGSGGTAGNVYAFEEYPSAVVKEVPASGLPAEIVTITDGGENLPMTSAEVSLSPQQDLNGYDAPWPGGGGKNLFDGSAVVFNKDSTASALNGITLTKYSDGTFNINGTASEETRLKLTQPIAFKSGNQYTISIRGISGEGLRVILQGKPSSGGIIYTSVYPSSDWIATYSTTEDCTFNYFFVDVQDGASVNFTLSVQIESGSTATAWFPYSNICPISGHTGAELIRAGKNLTSKTQVNNTVIAKVKEGVTYTFSLSNTGNVGINLKKNSQSGRTVAATQSTTTASRPALTFTADEDFSLFVNGYGAQGFSFLNCVSDFQLELGSSATDYEPYQGDTYSVTFSSQGTVYGGTYDFVTGKLVIDHVLYTDSGSANWVRNTNGSFYLLASLASSAEQTADGCYCNYAPYAVSFTGMSVFVRPTNSTISLGAGWGEIYATADELKAAFAQNPLQIVYKLATPLEYTLSAQQIETLLGENNVWSDAGEISNLVYRSNQYVMAYDWFETWMMPKITRNNGNIIVLPYPQEYTPEIYDVDASTTGRNAAGTMIRDRVAVKHKFNYKFPPLSQADATEILNAVRDSSFTLTTASPETGAKTNYRVYVGDRSLPVYWMPNHNNASWLYSSLSLNLIEM